MQILEERSFIDICAQRASESPDSIAFRFLRACDGESETITFSQLDNRAREIAVHLSGRAAAGDRALLLFQPGLEFIEAFLGCLYAGIVAVPAYPPKNNRMGSRIEKIVADCRASLALTTSDVLNRISPELLQSCGGAGQNWVCIDQVEAGNAVVWSEPAVTGETLAFLQYTSGSTGSPKGVMISHRNLMSNSACIAEQFGAERDACSVSWLPAYHDMGLIGGILQPIYSGVRTILMAPMAAVQNPLRWLQAISENRATYSGGPNFIYQLCANKIADADCHSLDLSSWKVAFTGAEPIRAETLRAFANKFARWGFRKDAFLPCYGLAEATLMVTANFQGQGATSKRFNAVELERGVIAPAQATERSQELIACGEPVAHHTVKIVDPKTHISLPPEAVGEIWVAGPSVSAGYWEKQETNAEIFEAKFANEPVDGARYMRTGDLGFFHNKQLYITGRAKELIIVAGRNHYPADIEDTVRSSHASLAVSAAAVFSTEAGVEEKLVILCELERRPADSNNKQEIARAIRAAVAEQHEVEVHEVVLVRTSSLPKTSSGKLQRLECKNQYQRKELKEIFREAQTAAPAVTAQETLTGEMVLSASPAARVPLVANHLLGCLARMTKFPVNANDVEKSIRDFGLSSMLLVELKLVVDELIGKEFDLPSFIAMPTVADLAQQCVSIIAEKETVLRAAPIQEAPIAAESPAQCPFHAADAHEEKAAPESQPAFIPPAASHLRQAPGPLDVGDAEIFSHINSSFFDYLLRLTRDYGQFVQFRLGKQLFFLSVDPDDLRDIFVKRRETFLRRGVWAPFKNLMGEHGLITTEGEQWRDERKSTYPMFMGREVVKERDNILRATEPFLAKLRALQPGAEPVDVLEDVKAITLQIILGKLFSLSDESRFSAMLAIVKPIDDLWNVPAAFVFENNQSASRLAGEDELRRGHLRVLEKLDPLVYALVDEHLASPDQCDDLLTGWMQSSYYQTLPESERRTYLRDAAITIILTGFDTTSSALFWTLYLLAKNPAAVERLRNEGGTDLERFASAGEETQGKCEYLDAVILEALRLYPPVWYVGREAVCETSVRGYRVPEGAFVLASPYVVHRNPWIWENPGQFQPERFLAGSGSPFNAKGYMPFGLGPRFCIGRGLALYEIALVIAAICREFDIRSTEPCAADLLTAFTLRPKSKVAIEFTPRP